MPLTFHELSITAVVEETADSRSFVFEVPPALEARFGYRAGQFLTFELPWGDFSVRRCYSLCSAPEVDAALKVVVKRADAGRVSNWMIDNLKVGDRIRVSPPDGRFVLKPDAGAAKLTLYAGGSGITPVISLLKSALHATSRNVTLIYANRSRNDIILARELDALWKESPDRLTIHHHIDADGGYLSVDQLRQLLRGREAGDHYVCGPTAFMDTVERAFEVAGIPGVRTCFERFNSPLDPDRRAGAARVEIDTSEIPREFVVRLNGKKHTVPYEPGLTLLASAQKYGIKPPSSCEDGYCGSCMARLVTGNVAMKQCQALTEKEVARGRILLCQSLPISSAPLEVDYDSTSFRARPSAGARAQLSVPARVVAGVLVAVVVIALLVLRSYG